MNNIHLLLLIPAAIFFYFLPNISQDLEYHNFADQRTIFWIPNFLDVVSNVGFLFVGICGFGVKTMNTFATNIYFGGVMATCFGSAYYHLDPNNTTLVWDRLPMAITFMALLVGILEKRVNRFFGKMVVQILFILFGILSVVWWALYDDLKLYILAQFGSLAYIIYLLYKQRKYRDNHLLNMAILFYVVAKVLELFDKQTFYITQEMVSGHTLKHLAAAVGAWYGGKFMVKTDKEKDEWNVLDDFV